MNTTYVPINMYPRIAFRKPKMHPRLGFHRGPQLESGQHSPGSIAAFLGKGKKEGKEGDLSNLGNLAPWCSRGGHWHPGADTNNKT